MEWIVGESPTDLLAITAGNSVNQLSTYSDRQKIDAKRRLLDLVGDKFSSSLLILASKTYFHDLNETLS